MMILIATINQMKANAKKVRILFVLFELLYYKGRFTLKVLRLRSLLSLPSLNMRPSPFVLNEELYF